jgi:hypothetical protein
METKRHQHDSLSIGNNSNSNESYHQYEMRMLNIILLNHLTSWPTVIINMLIEYALSPFGIFTFGGSRRRGPASEQVTFIKPSLHSTGVIDIEILPFMPSARQFACAARIDEYIYVNGGLESPVSNPHECKLVSSMIRYHIPSRTWSSSCSSMLVARYQHCMVRLPEPKSHCLMVMGGADNNDKPLSTCEIFNTLTNEWSPAPSMADARLNFGSCVSDHRIYVFGGKCDTSCVYDVQTNEWCAIQQSPMRDDDEPGAHGVPVVVGDDAILLLGNDSQRRIEEYTPSTDTWRILPWDLPDDSTRYHCGAAYDSVADSLLIIGGCDLKYSSMLPYIRHHPLHLETNEWIECSRNFEYHTFSYCS